MLDDAGLTFLRGWEGDKDVTAIELAAEFRCAFQSMLAVLSTKMEATLVKRMQAVVQSLFTPESAAKVLNGRQRDFPELVQVIDFLTTFYKTHPFGQASVRRRERRRRRAAY